MDNLVRQPDNESSSLGEAQVAELEATAEIYRYKPLVNVLSDFRILILEPGEEDDPLKGTLAVLNTAVVESYEPISYVWGEPTRSSTIQIRDESVIGTLWTTNSLNRALRRLRYPDRARRIWADQICVNQDDPFERNQQVQLMADIYKKATRVLVWLGLDHQHVAESALQLVQELDHIFQDEVAAHNFHIDHTEDLERQSRERWAALDHLTNLPWFFRGWIVQEVGFNAPATLFWGKVEFDRAVLHRVCEGLSNYQYLRSKFNIRTSDIKYTYQRFIEPDLGSYHANRFSFIYELHRARGQRVTDPRDRVFAFLGHFSVRASNAHLAAIEADYTKTVVQVYIDVAKRTLRDASIEDSKDRPAGQFLRASALITLAAVQHPTLPSHKTGTRHSGDDNSRLGDDYLPSWVPDWRLSLGFMLSEPIHPQRAQGKTSPRLDIDEDNLILTIHGLRLDTIKRCSRILKARDFQQTSSSGTELPIQFLWHDTCGKGRFDLIERYHNGDSAFFAYMQTLSNGCIQNAHRESPGGRSYGDIPDSTWLAHAAAYLVRALGQSEEIAPELYELARTEEAKEGYIKWNRVANAATTNRVFAITVEGSYVLAPKVAEEGDIVCLFFGGKIPFLLRPWNGRYLLVGECYVHGFMHAEAIDLLERGEIAEEAFDIV